MQPKSGRKFEYSVERGRGLDTIKILPLETKLFENSSSSSCSSPIESESPFSEPVFNEHVLIKMRQKQMYGKNLYEAFNFSNEFKTAIKGAKREIRGDGGEGTTTKEDAAADAEATPIARQELLLSHDSKAKGANVGGDGGGETEEAVRVLDLEDLTPGQTDPRKARGSSPSSDETFFDNMSGYWRMLSVYDQFRISPPWYDAYAEGKKHWLQTDAVPADVMESSRLKCLNWLNECSVNDGS